MKSCLIIISILLFNSKTNPSYKIKWEHFKGTIYLQNKDSLTGEVLLYPISNKGLLVTTNFLGFTTEPGINSRKPGSIQWIKFRDIQKIKIDIPEQSLNITYEYLQYKKTLWRQLRTNGNVSIYSDMIMPRWGLQYAPKRVIVKSGGEVESMYSGFDWFFHNSKTKPLLKNFINRRYHTSFKKTDFKDEDDELNYIITHG